MVVEASLVAQMSGRPPSTPPPSFPFTPFMPDDQYSLAGSCGADQNCDNLGESGGILDEFSMMKFSAVTRQRTAVAARPSICSGGSLMAGRLQAPAVADPEVGKPTN